MPLSAMAIRNAKPKDAPYKLSDEHGLYLLVETNGSMLWRFKYRVNGAAADGTPKRVEKKLSFGAYPIVGLKEAREKRDDARRDLAAGLDPGQKRKQEEQQARVAAANTFAVVAEAYIAKNEREGLAEATIRKRRWFLSLVARPLGNRPISQIEPFEILEAVRPYEEAKNDEKAHRTLEFIGQVFRYAVAAQLAPRDPTRDLRGALTRRRPKNFAAILEPAKVGELLRAIEGYEGYAYTKIALQLTPHLFQRPGEIRSAEWAHIDLDQAEWRLPAEKMKARREHVVYLSRQAVELFSQAYELSGHGRYVFPSVQGRDRCMSENTINGALRRLGYTGDEMTAHGFRAMASTLLNESGLWTSDAIERAMAHGDKDRVRAAYHRGAHRDERIAMAQWWSDYLDGLRGEAGPDRTNK